jgi:hypothetical protein
MTFDDSAGHCPLNPLDSYPLNQARIGLIDRTFSFIRSLFSHHVTLISLLRRLQKLLTLAPPGSMVIVVSHLLSHIIDGVSFTVSHFGSDSTLRSTASYSAYQSIDRSW